MVPRASAVDHGGKVYIAGGNGNNLFRIKVGGAIDELIDATGDGTNPLTAPIATVAPAKTRAVVAGLASSNAFEIVSSSNISQIIDGTGDGVNALLGASDVAADADRNVAVTGAGSRITPSRSTRAARSPRSSTPRATA